jgi:hypothetical protein
MMLARACLLLFAVLACPFSAYPQAAPPENMQQYDLGKLEPVPDLELSVPFKNSTGATVEIWSVSWSCECISADFEPKVLEPGGVGYLQVTMDFASKRGSFAESIDVFTNVPGKGSLRFQFLGYVISDVEVQPGQLFFDISDSGSAASAKITLESTKAPLIEARILDLPDWLDYEIKTLTIEPPKMDEEHIEMAKYGIVSPVAENSRNLAEFRFNVLADKLPLKKSGSGKIVFATDPAYADPVFATINWQRETMYAVSPKQIEISSADHTNQHFRFSLKRIDGQPFDIRDVSINSYVGGLEICGFVKVSETELEVELLNNVEAAHLGEAGKALGKATIETDTEDDPIIEIPIIVKNQRELIVSNKSPAKPEA